MTNSIILVNDTSWSWAVGANETWAFIAYPVVNGPGTAPNTTNPGGIRMQMTLPGVPTNCRYTITEYSTANKADTVTCNSALAMATTASATIGSVIQFYGSFTSNTAGTAQIQWAQSAASASSTIIRANSYLIAYKISGADYAELYYDDIGNIAEGDIVQLSGAGVSQIEKTSTPYQDKAIGIASTKPGQVIGENDGVGKPIAVALNGRVPVKVTTSNGDIIPGDYITTSDIA